MKRLLAAAAVIVVVGTVVSAHAATRQASIGNYWYEDDTQRDQTKITVSQGDQITFTVREASVPGHTVDVDALDIHSPNLAVGQTFTTPKLNRPGNFYLYCRPHEQRGHYTRLVVLAAPRATPAPTAKPTQRPAATRRPAAAPARPSTPVPSPAPSRTPMPTESLTPVGVGTAPPGSMDKPVPTDPNSLSALTGRTFARGVPWTRSLWWLAFAAVPIVAAGAIALRRARIAQYQPTFENLRRARASAATPPVTTEKKRPAEETATRKPPPRKAKAAPRKKPPRKR